MAALDLSRADLSRLGARLILLHGRDDAIIPFTQSLALAAAAPAARLSSSVTRAAGSVRIFRSSSPRTWKRPSSASFVT